MRALALAITIAFATTAGTARASAPDPTDYDPRSNDWNGLASFVALAEGMGFEVTPVSTLDWGELTANDVLVLLYPLQRVDPARLATFISAGGNAMIADDFGESGEAFDALGLVRGEITAPSASRFEDNHLWAPIATVRAADHPIATGVDEVVTNHPAAMTHVAGATEVIGFERGALVVAGERGTGRFVAISDPSIFINCMQQFPGDVAVVTNTLRWLGRSGGARRIVLVRGDVPMFGEPRPYIPDPNASGVGNSINELNDWIDGRREWLLTTPAMRIVAASLAVALLMLALFALPVRRGPRSDGAWLRAERSVRRDDPHALLAADDRDPGANMVLASVLRDQVQALVASALAVAEPLYTLPESELVTRLTEARGGAAGAAFAQVFRRLRGLPSRSQAAAPWSAGELSRREFDALYKDVAELCRTLGEPLEQS